MIHLEHLRTDGQQFVSKCTANDAWWDWIQQDVQQDECWLCCQAISDSSIPVAMPAKPHGTMSCCLDLVAFLDALRPWQLGTWKIYEHIWSHHLFQDKIRFGKHVLVQRITEAVPTIETFWNFETIRPDHTNTMLHHVTSLPPLTLSRQWGNSRGVQFQVWVAAHKLKQIIQDKPWCS